jgi:hypothetical protein
MVLEGNSDTVSVMEFAWDQAASMGASASRARDDGS